VRYTQDISLRERSLKINKLLFYHEIFLQEV
jgi:hypothetical protein